MADKNEKERRRQIMNELRKKADEEFEGSLPMDRSIFNSLFDYLDTELGEKGCSHNLKITMSFLSSNNITNSDAVVLWLGEHGGYCDCEVLANVEQLFEN